MRLGMTAAPPSVIDVLIVGAGIAGASLAVALAPWRRVMLIEAEDTPGYHSTGRSAAFWHETYGGAKVQPLSVASFDTLARPAPEFSERGFLSPRAALTVGRSSEAAAVVAFAAERDGAHLAIRAPLVSARRTGGGWEAQVGGETIHAALIVNAAGAWADRVAAACGVAPVGIRPYRRTVVQLRLGVAVPAELPLIVHVGGDFYFKGESEGRVWLSPHDETPVEPHDAAPEDVDVAIAVDRLQAVVDWPVAAVERKWAGLRSFAPDRVPVFGADPHQPGFIWCAGQGGVGIQTSPAIAALLAAELGAPPPGGMIGAVDPAPFAASRFA